MKLALASDLHSEFYTDENWLPPLPSTADILVLAGDIGVGEQAITFVHKVAAKLPKTTILWVAGNHEFYRQNIDKTKQLYFESFQDNPQVHFLDNTSITLNGWTFLGCTLWSGFDGLGLEKQQEVMATINGSLADFSLIRSGIHNDRFTPETALRLYEESHKWLRGELSKADPDKTVIISHFSPSLNICHPHFPTSAYSAYFSANCDDLIKRYQPKYWLYGHNHWSDQVTMGNTVIVSNQLGYPEEKGLIPIYNKNLEIVLEP